MSEIDAALIKCERERMHAELAERAYRDIPEHRGIKVGARVRHRGHRWLEAYLQGTATVLAVMQKGPSPWSVSWGRPDVEVLALPDNPMFPTAPVHGWADYHCEVVDAPENPSPASPPVFGATEARRGAE
jgi:hypothetical protein